jgi:glucokinase
VCGDIGGTRARLALWQGGLGPVSEFSSGEFSGVLELVQAWIGPLGVRPTAACLAIAGPVRGGRCRTTNLPWEVDAEALGRALGMPVHLVNDFHAAALGARAVGPLGCVQLLPGTVEPGAPFAVLGAGTGLGEAVGVGSVVLPGEGGHAEFGPGSAREARLSEWLQARYGRATWERVLSGQGLVNLARFQWEERGEVAPVWASANDAPARVAATEPEVVAWFAELYGAEAGNLALRVLARGGVYLAGGIGPRILSVLRSGGFERRFREKGKVAAAIADVPVFVADHPALGLLGAHAELVARGA